MKIFLDAVIRNAVLRKIIGADFLAPFPRADLSASLRLARAALFFLLKREKPRAHHLHGFRAILLLRALVLARDHYSGWNMSHANSGVGRIYGLAAVTSRG